MKKCITALAALCLTLCLITVSPAAEAAQPDVPVKQGIDIYGRFNGTVNYYEITLGNADTAAVTLPDDIVLQGFSTSAADNGLEVIIIPVTPADEPDAFTWAAKTAITLGQEPIIYYLMFYRGNTPATPSGMVHITMSTRSGYENALLYYMDGDARTVRLRYAKSDRDTSFTMDKDGYYMFLKSPSDTPYDPPVPAPDLPSGITSATTGDGSQPVLWSLLALLSAAGLTALARRRQRSVS